VVVQLHASEEMMLGNSHSLPECIRYAYFFFFQAEDGIRDWSVTGVQTCALPISGCYTKPFHPQQPARINGMTIIDKIRSRSISARHFAKLIRVFAVTRSQHQNQVYLPSQLLYGVLSILSCIADVLFSRSDHSWEPFLQNINHFTGIIHAQCCLRE